MPRQYSNAFEATISGIRDLFSSKDRVAGLGPEDRLYGKTVMITGASSGLGKAAAAELARRGANLIMACRSGIPEIGEGLKDLTGNPNIEMRFVDLSSLASIRQLTTGLQEDGVVLDVLICNAAMVPAGSRRSVDGLEEMFVVNYLSKFFLVNSLLKSGVLSPRDGERPRIVIVSSESHRNPDGFDWKNFGEYEAYRMKDVIHRYGYFKLLLTTFAVELSRRLNADERTGVVVRALCPGPVNSKIAREAPVIARPLLKVVFRLFFRSPDKACEPVVYFAALRSVTKPFDYFFLMAPRAVDDLARDPKNGKILWKRSEQLLESMGYSL